MKILLQKTYHIRTSTATQYKNVRIINQNLHQNSWDNDTIHVKTVYYYLCQGGNVFARLCLFVCLSVCEQDNTKSYGRIFLKFWGYVGHGTNYQWFNLVGDPEGILDSGSLWNFRYHCFQWGIRETAAKPKMVLPPSEQHCLGGGVRVLTAF